VGQHRSNGCSIWVVFDGEPRVLDLRLAELLEFERPRVIRELIKRNAAELERYGGLPCHAANPGPGSDSRVYAYSLQGAGLHRSRAPTLNFFNVTRQILLNHRTVGLDLRASAIASVLMGRAIASGWQGPPNFREWGGPTQGDRENTSAGSERAGVSGPCNRKSP
jgi:hypothetical protein